MQTFYSSSRAFIVFDDWICGYPSDDTSLKIINNIVFSNDRNTTWEIVMWANLDKACRILRFKSDYLRQVYPTHYLISIKTMNSESTSIYKKFVCPENNVMVFASWLLQFYNKLLKRFRKCTYGSNVKPVPPPFPEHLTFDHNILKYDSLYCDSDANKTANPTQQFWEITLMCHFEISDGIIEYFLVKSNPCPDSHELSKLVNEKLKHWSKSWKFIWNSDISKIWTDESWKLLFINLVPIKPSVNKIPLQKCFVEWANMRRKLSSVYPTFPCTIEQKKSQLSKFSRIWKK